MTEQCNRCRFWCEDMSARDPNDADWGFGDCRRRPPVLSEVMVEALRPKPVHHSQIEPEMDVVGRQVASPFPATFATDWCGEFVGRRPIAVEKAA